MGLLQDGRVLVTGAEGFIGSHLTEALVESGCRVRAFVLYNSFNSWGWLDTLPREILDQVEVYAGDIRDLHCVRQAMKDCTVVMHLAALIAIPYSYRSPESYVETNVNGTLNVVQAARELGVKKVVHTSTSEVYGTAQFIPITEEHPLQGQSPYSASKIGADQIALSFYRSFDTPVAVIRPFNTYGPRQSARAVIPTIITQLIAGCRSLQLGALHPTRDFSYVKDTVRGFCAVAESAESVGEVINIGSGHEISIGDLATMIAELMETEAKWESDEARLRPAKSEVFRLWADNSKARRLLGWSPQYQGSEGLREGLRESIAWFSRPENLKFYKSNIYNV
ncbi:MAG: NAD-dependent 4,6-dehydratase LegB [Terracidiphilus sp.]